MIPVGALMIEHRLIERMVGLIQREIPRIRGAGRVSGVLLDAIVDFSRTYSDETHHGKEEDILFRDLARKSMSQEDQDTMARLIAEHQYARGVVGELVQAEQAYLGGHQASLALVLEKLDALVALYPGHIKLEDKVFFPASRGYLSQEEQQAMLVEFHEWDQKMIHRRYRSTVEALETLAEPFGALTLARG